VIVDLPTSNDNKSTITTFSARGVATDRRVM